MRESTTVAVRRRVLVSSFVIVVGIAALGGAVGYNSYNVRPQVGPMFTVSDGGFLDAFATIFVQNISAALLCFSGVVTLGLTTLVGVFLTGAWIGVTLHVAVAEVGISEVVLRTGPYVGLEFGGIALAATAGLLPAISLVARWIERGGSPRWSTMTLSLFLLALGSALILVGAAVEAMLVVQASEGAW